MVGRGARRWRSPVQNAITRAQHRPVVVGWQGRPATGRRHRRRDLTLRWPRQWAQSASPRPSSDSVSRVSAEQQSSKKTILLSPPSTFLRRQIDGRRLRLKATRSHKRHSISPIDDASPEVNHLSYANMQDVSASGRKRCEQQIEDQIIAHWLKPAQESPPASLGSEAQGKIAMVTTWRGLAQADVRDRHPGAVPSVASELKSSCADRSANRAKHHSRCARTSQTCYNGALPLPPEAFGLTLNPNRCARCQFNIVASICAPASTSAAAPATPAGEASTPSRCRSSSADAYPPARQGNDQTPDPGAAHGHHCDGTKASQAVQMADGGGSCITRRGHGLHRRVLWLLVINQSLAPSINVIRDAHALCGRLCSWGLSVADGADQHLSMAERQRGQAIAVLPALRLCAAVLANSGRCSSLCLQMVYPETPCHANLAS